MNNTPIIDMHCHTTESDGAQLPEVVYRHATEKDIQIFAITDHDKITRDHNFLSGIQESGQFLLEGVEVSARYEHDGFRKSIHVPIYGLSLGENLQEILINIRKGKQEKIIRQCEKLKRNGCMIELPGGAIVPFSFEAVRANFPNTPGDGFNNGHLVELVRRYRKNLKKLEEIAPGITEENLLREGFKSDGKYTKSISLENPIKEYEPRIEELVEAVKHRTTILSLAHPNFTFRSIDEFRTHIGHILDQGLNAIEINARASQEWVNEILLAQRVHRSGEHQLPPMLTYGSDCHDIVPKRHDARHSLLGEVNPYVPSHILRNSQDEIYAIFHESQYL